MHSLNTPDWHAATQSLINGFQVLPSLDDRIRLTEKLCDKLGGNLYPAFLQILYNIEQHGDSEAQTLVTSTLIYGLQTGRLPSGKLSAWGSSSPGVDNAFGSSRTLGPIEYLCAWYSQPTDQSPLTLNAFKQVGSSLLRLVDSNEAAKQFYCSKLSTEAEDPLGGSMSSKTRTALSSMSEAWASGHEPDSVIDAYVDALQSNSLLSQISLNNFPKTP